MKIKIDVMCVIKLVGTIAITTSITAHAIGVSVSGTGEYRFGPETAENVACAIAEERAKENAIANFVGEYIEVQINEVCKDQQCTQYRSMFNETSGVIQKILNKNLIIAPEKKYSVCIVDIEAHVQKVKNQIEFTVKGKNNFRHGERFAVSAISNHIGHFAVFNLINDTYIPIYTGKILKANAEFSIPGNHQKMNAVLPANVHQSKELLVFLFSKNDLTFQQSYSILEFERLIKNLSFSDRRLINHSVNIVR